MSGAVAFSSAFFQPPLPCAFLSGGPPAASEAKQIERVMARDRSTREAALARIRAQGPLEEKVRAATYVIDNNGDLASTQAQADAVLAKILGGVAAR